VFRPGLRAAGTGPIAGRGRRSCGPGCRRTGCGATGPSSRSVTRCPASGSPTLIMWLPRLTLPEAFTVRSTSITSPDVGGSGGGPAGRAPAAARRARSRASSRDGRGPRCAGSGWLSLQPSLPGSGISTMTTGSSCRVAAVCQSTPVRASARVWPRSGCRATGALGMARDFAGGARFPPLILVTTGPGEDLVVLEGHARLTAFMLASDRLPPELEVLVGSSPMVTR
jgi:hypothetical protein